MSADPTADDAPHPTAGLLRGQDPAAFAWLVERTRRVVLGLGQAVGLRGADLDDAAAEVYLAVYRALPAYEGRAAATTWAYPIAVRTLQRVGGKLRRNRPAAFDERAHAPPDAPARAPDAAAERRERDERVWAAVADLEPRSAMAVELHYHRGLSVDDVAAALGCPAGTVKTLLYRAREALRPRLSGALDGP